jgi:putative ABC transport system permease protein
MRQLTEYIKCAIKQIILNGYRTLMTMVGIIVGIAAVIAVVALGNGMSAYVKNSLNELAGNYGMLSLDSKKTSEVFTREDIALMEDSLPDIYGISPNIEVYGKVAGRRETYHCSITGGAPCYEKALSNGIVKGQYFTRQQLDDAQRVCVIMREDAKKIFGTEDAVGLSLDITMWGKTATYTVVGIRENMNEMYTFLMQGQEYYATIEAPYTAVGADFDLDTDNFTQLYVFADQEILAKRVTEAKEIMENVHGLRGTKAISSMSMADISDQLDTILGYATTFLLLVSVISLIVGGIGVMNIMLVSVTERTKEIGIRKSIGASTGAIMTQFLAEAAILTLLGGILGIILGIIAAHIICTLIGFDVIITPTSVGGAALFSILIGIFFGLYPARKAAKMRPVDALRL